MAIRSDGVWTKKIFFRGRPNTNRGEGEAELKLASIRGPLLASFPYARAHHIASAIAKRAQTKAACFRRVAPCHT